MLGQEFLKGLDEQDFEKIDLNNQGDTIILDQLWQAFDKLAKQGTIGDASLLVDGGIEAGGTTITLEINVINLPLRYTNQLKKIIDDNTDYPLMVVAFVENTLISSSKMKIQQMSSLLAYQDDSESLHAKIESWISDQMQIISDNFDQKALEKTE